MSNSSPFAVCTVRMRMASSVSSASDGSISSGCARRREISLDELPDRASDALVVGERDRAHVLEMAQRALSVRRGRVDVLDAAGADHEIDQLRDGEMARGRPQRFEHRGELLIGLVAERDLRIGQREVRRARRRDLGAAIERKGDGAKHGQQIDGRADDRETGAWPAARSGCRGCRRRRDSRRASSSAAGAARTCAGRRRAAGSTPRSPPLPRRSDLRDRRRPARREA